MKALSRFTLLFLLFFSFSNVFSQPISIDSLSIYPLLPTENDSVYFIINVTHASTSCDIHSPNVNPIQNDTIRVDLSFTAGMLGAICYSVDTFCLGILSSGNYTLIVSIPIFGPNPPPSPIDTLDFTVNISTSTNSLINLKDPTRIYPNPSEGLLFVEIEKNDLELEIADINGRIIFSKQFNNHSSNTVEKIDLSNFSKGIYFVKIKNSNSINVEKLLIE